MTPVGTEVEHDERGVQVLTTCLGEGGFGEVYLADLLTGRGLQRQVAVELLRDHMGFSAQAVRRMRDEARLLAALNLRAILVVYDLVDVEGRLAMVTEYLPGQDLADVAVPGQPLPLRVQQQSHGADQ